MPRMIESMSSDEIVNLTLFSISRPLEPQSPQEVDGDLCRGASLFQDHCQGCHGEDGRGASGYATLEGQKAEYMRIAMQQYRANDAGRSDVFMRQGAARLTDADFRDGTTYLTTLQPKPSRLDGRIPPVSHPSRQCPFLIQVLLTRSY